MNSVREAVDAINQAWRRGNFDALKPLLDENVVMRGPGLKELLRGRDAFIESYVEFMTRSRILEYQESGHAIDVWGDAAAIRYDWKMTYEQKGATKTEAGQDMFVFHRAGAAWVAVMRVILF